MTFKILKYKRLLIILGYCAFLWISGLVVMPLAVEFTGVLCLLSSLMILFYTLISFVLKRTKIFQAIRQKEHWVALSWLGFICVSGAIESFVYEPTITVIFILLFLFLLLFGYSIFRKEYLRKHKVDSLGQEGIIKFASWLLGIGAAMVLLVAIFNEMDLLFFILAPVYFIVLLLLGIRWLVRQLKLIIKLKNEQAKTELLHLQTQVNPHFFFNTLNNLYGLVAIDAPKAQELILKLSDMMRYSIYDGQKQLVELEEEVVYLQNYIELHKMRYHKQIEVDFEIDLSSETHQVMPLMFIILLENAFKHGVENLRSDAYVRLSLTADENSICFIVENNFDPAQQATTSGIGLKNLQRRLELVYPNQHSLICEQMGETYLAELRLTLV